MFMDYRIRRTS